MRITCTDRNNISEFVETAEVAAIRFPPDDCNQRSHVDGCLDADTE